MFINIPSNASPQWKDPVATAAELPTGSFEGETRVVLDTGALVYWDGAAWQTIASGGGGGITSLNGLTVSTQTFATGTSGSDFNISSSSGVHTFNVPDASATARGVITTGTQTLAGDKTFSGSVEVQGTLNASGTVTGIDEYKVQSFTLDGTAITNKQVTLSEAPTTASDTLVFVVGGPIQDYTTDFTVSGTTLDWNGLGLETLLETGDKIIVIYN